MTLDELLPGLRLAAFEILEPALPELRRLDIRADQDGCIEAVPEWEATPTEEDGATLRYLVEEVIAVAFEDGQVPPVRFAAGRHVGVEYLEVVSPKLHESIALHMSPHRLKDRN